MDDLTDRERVEIWNLVRSEIIVKKARGTSEQVEHLRPVLKKIGHHGCNLRIGDK